MFRQTISAIIPKLIYAVQFTQTGLDCYCTVLWPSQITFKVVCGDVVWLQSQSSLVGQQCVCEFKVSQGRPNWNGKGTV